MNCRKYQTDPAILLKQGKDILKTSENPKYPLRIFAVNMVLSGISATQVGVATGYTKATITSWVKLVNEQGFEALWPKQHPGRPAKLSGEMKAEVAALLQSEAKEHGYEAWDEASLSNWINMHYQVEIGARQCRKLLSEAGCLCSGGGGETFSAKK